MSPDAKKAIDNLKPYKDGNESLWRIHYFDIVDKHHQTFVMGYQVRVFGMQLPGTFGAIARQPAHFLGLFTEDFAKHYPDLGQSIATELEALPMKPLIPALKELLVYTENLIQEFKPMLGLRKPSAT